MVIQCDCILKRFLKLNQKKIVKMMYGKIYFLKLKFKKNKMIANTL